MTELERTELRRLLEKPPISGSPDIRFFIAVARRVIPVLLMDLEAAEAQNILLSRAYAYADHLPSCPATHPVDADCDCGYREIAAAVEET